MNNSIGTILNVKLPFSEALEEARDETTYVGIINGTMSKIIYIDHGELIVKNSSSSVNLTIDDVIKEDWFLILRKK